MQNTIGNENNIAEQVTPEIKQDDLQIDSSAQQVNSEVEQSVEAVQEPTFEQEKEAQPTESSPQGEKAEQNPFILAEENEEFKKMEKDYKEYLSKKILSKIDGLVCPTISHNDAERELQTVVRTRKARAVVYPSTLSQARKIVGDGNICCVVNRYGEMSKKAVLCEIKEALRYKAQVVVGLNLTKFLSGSDVDATRQLKILKKLSKKGDVTPMVLSKHLGEDDCKRIAKLVDDLGFSRLTVFIDGDFDEGANAVKSLFEYLSERCVVEALFDVTHPEQLNQLFSAGAERIITTNYRRVSRMRLDTVSI